MKSDQVDRSKLITIFVCRYDLFARKITMVLFVLCNIIGQVYVFIRELLSQAFTSSHINGILKKERK